tara:strand:- start:2541 stop:2975 length:435 start_codon:yes stop_codon:yes gene_type:complete
MAHFAKLNDSNVVLEVVVIADSDAPNEAAGIAFCKSLFGDDTNWKQTSYNTFEGTHGLGGTPFRLNYAGGNIYDPTLDGFIEVRPADDDGDSCASWTLNNSTGKYVPPIAMPDDGKVYKWDESVHQADNTQGWVKVADGIASGE